VDFLTKGRSSNNEDAPDIDEDWTSSRLQRGPGGTRHRGLLLCLPAFVRRGGAL